MVGTFSLFFSCSEGREQGFRRATTLATRALSSSSAVRECVASRSSGPVATTTGLFLVGRAVADGRFSVYRTHVSSRELIRELQAAGWTLDRRRGSHHVFKHPDRPGIVVVPHPKKDLGKGLIAAIRRQAGV